MATQLKTRLSLAPAPNATIETVGTTEAKRYLATMKRNRPISQGRVIEFATAIDEGKWVVNGETIKFDSNGELFDGQHRLEAVILAGKPIITHVVRGIDDPRAFSTVDVGAPRTHGDIFALGGYVAGKGVSSAAMLVYFYKKAMLTMKGPRGFSRTGRELVKGTPYAGARGTCTVAKEDLLAFAEPYRESLVGAERFAARLRFNLMPRSMLVALHVLFADKAGIHEAEPFFTMLRDGLGLTVDDPIHLLRQRLIGNATSKAGKLNRYAIMALTIKAWNTRRAGKRGGAYFRVHDTDPFPNIK